MAPFYQSDYKKINTEAFGEKSIFSYIREKNYNIVRDTIQELATKIKTFKDFEYNTGRGSSYSKLDSSEVNGMYMS